MDSTERHILNVLAEAGSTGISVRMLVLNVYNLSSTLFERPCLDDIAVRVRRFVARNSATPASLLERMDRRGYYRLNLARSAEARQLELAFSDEAGDV